VLASAWLWPRLGHPGLVLGGVLATGLASFAMARRLFPRAGGRLWAGFVLAGMAAFAPALWPTPVALEVDPRRPAAVFLGLAVLVPLVTAVAAVRRSDGRALAAALALVATVAAAAGWLVAGGDPAYRTVDVAWRNGHVSIEGTLHLPKGEGPHPLLVLVGGSGPNTRQWGPGWAHVLAGRGVGVLAYDKRGSGASEGGSPRDPFAALGSDIVAGIDSLAARPDIDTDRLALLGFSEGAWVAPAAAAMADRVDALVLVSGAGVSVGRNIEFQGSIRLADAGLADQEVDAVWELRRAVNDYYRSGAGRDEVLQLVDRAMAQPWWDAAYQEVPLPTADEVAEYASAEAEDWIAYWDFEALPILELLGVPVLSVDAGRDRQNPGPQSAAAMRDLIDSAGLEASRALLYAEAGHTIGISPFGIEALPPHYPAGYLETVADWVAERLRAR